MIPALACYTQTSWHACGVEPAMFVCNTPCQRMQKNGNLKVHSLSDRLALRKRFQDAFLNFTWGYMLGCSPQEREFSAVHRYNAHTQQLLVLQIMRFYKTNSYCTRMKIGKKK
jgi:hypothetical protein